VQPRCQRGTQEGLIPKNWANLPSYGASYIRYLAPLRHGGAGRWERHGERRCGCWSCGRRPRCLGNSLSFLSSIAKSKTVVVTLDTLDMKVSSLQGPSLVLSQVVQFHVDFRPEVHAFRCGQPAALDQCVDKLGVVGLDLCAKLLLGFLKGR
jgi:hypothetical protein